MDANQGQGNQQGQTPVPDNQQSQDSQQGQQQSPLSPSVGWNQMLGDYAQDPSIQKFRDPKDLAKSYIELQKLVGKDKVPVPKSEEELPQVLSKLGLPEKPDGYPSFGDEVNIFGSKEDAQGFKELAHESGLLPAQYKKLYEGLKAATQQDNELMVQERKQQATQALSQLQQEYGDNTKQKLTLAQRVFNTFSDDVKESIMKSGLDVNPNFVKALASLGEYYKEDTFVANNYSPMDAKSELEAVKNNPNHPYFHKEHPEHKAAVEKVQALYKVIYGNK